MIVEPSKDVTHKIITLRLNPAEDHFYAVVNSILKEVTITKDKKGKDTKVFTDKIRFHIFKYKFTKDFKFELVQDYLCSKKDGNTIL